jgi:SAF domain
MHEVRRLRDPRGTPGAAGVETVDELWGWVGQDPYDGLGLVSHQTEISRRRLQDLLVAQGLREAKAQGGSWWQRHWLDLALFVAPLVLGTLLARALGGFADVPPPVSLRAGAVVLARDLAAGQVLTGDDLLMARLEPSARSFTRADDARGLVLTRSVAAARPLRFDDVLRLEVVAVKDVSVSTAVPRDAVGLAWSSYEADAAWQLEQVVGMRVRYALHSGSVVRLESIEGAAARELQVVARGAVGLPAFQLIGPGDVELADVPVESGSLHALDEAIGRYPLQPIAGGGTLRASQLSAAVLYGAELMGRELVSLPLKSGAVGPTVKPGDHVAVLFAPHDRAAQQTPSAVDDAIVWGVDRRGEMAALVVAVKAEARATLSATLGTADVFVLQSVAQP